MTIMVWWPYQEKASLPKDGRYREAHVIETEVPNNENDDEGRFTGAFSSLFNK